MDRATFNSIVEKQLEECKLVLVKKGEEYAPTTEEDRLEHFKKAANLMECSLKKATFNMLAKHLVSISDMCNTTDRYSDEKWSEKIDDSINYLCILKACIEEEKKSA